MKTLPQLRLDPLRPIHEHIKAELGFHKLELKKKPKPVGIRLRYLQRRCNFLGACSSLLIAEAMAIEFPGGLPQ